MSADMRAVTAQSDRVGRYFARQHSVSGNDFHALLHVMVAETAGKPLTMAQLRQRMDVSPAAITYLVDRMIDAGHVRRESDPADRRKALLRYEASGMELAHGFFTPLGVHLRAALADLPDRGSGRRAPGVQRDDRRDVLVRGRCRSFSKSRRRRSVPLPRAISSSSKKTERLSYWIGVTPI